MIIQERLRGVNLGGWFSQIDSIEEKDPEDFPGVDNHIDNFLGIEDFEYCKDSGFNHVRLPVDYQVLFDDAGSLAFPHRMLKLQKAVNHLLDLGFYVILDLHKCPGHDFQEGHSDVQRYFYDAEPQRATLKIWEFLADTFNSDQRVVFEILNEPVAMTNEIWDNIKNDLVSQIRKMAPDNTIIVGSNLWNRASTFIDLSPVPEDDNILYNFHYYLPHPFTHQRAPWMTFAGMDQVRDYPGEYLADPMGQESFDPNDYGRWDRDRMKSILEPVLRFREKYMLPVMCDEFGVYHQSPRDSQLRWLRDLLGIFKEADIGWTYWTYKNLDFGIVSKGEKLHRDLPQFQNSDRRDDGIVEVLQNY